MRFLPRDEIILGGMLRCPPRELDVKTWQAHLVKHPLGRNALERRAVAAWNEERWDALVPPVITEEARPQLLDAIRALETADQRCGARELWGKATKAEKEPCYECEAPLVHLCFKALNAPDRVGPRYAERTESLLRSFADAVRVSRKDLAATLWRFLRTPEKLEGLSVLHVGMDRGGGNKRIARISGSDGVVVELYLNGGVLVWRTTYREPQAVATPSARVTFLQRAPVPDNRLGTLSDAALVTRGWWETHGG